MHGVPYTNHGMVVYYRKDLFEAAGITEEPKTYEELLAANDKLLAAGTIPSPSAARTTGTSCACSTACWRPSAAPRCMTR